MKHRSTSPILSHVLAVLLFFTVAACAAPTPPGPPAPPMSIETIVVPAEVPALGFAGQIIEPLIEVSTDGSFHPGLAESWNTTITVDGKYLMVNFLLSPNWSLDNNSSIPSEHIPKALLEIATRMWEDDPGLVSAGDAGGNPCVTPIPTRADSQSSEPFSVFQVSGGRTISIMMPLTEDCQKPDTTCAAPILNFVASAPIFNPSVFTFKHRTNTGLYVFADSSGWVEYDPRIDVTKRCTGPECEKRDPSSPKTVCTPTPTSTGSPSGH